ncbi:DUF2177 family protein [Roseovarius sp. SYSU LYC5161]|uniref:DUF2177 family protein n=1 Tax=Roseovarius halophilus (ex Wu et al. 2025) TaxID=3376060 RepID=UPI0028722FD3|nr:DUF2177 family protein [Roseovarius sp.]
MFQILVLYLVTAGVFLALDAVMLSTVMKPLFEAHVADLMADRLRLGPAAVFYLFYVAGLLWLVSVPALRDGAPLRALLGGAVLGAVAYGTYEVTNLATLRGWSWRMVAADVAWGTLLTAISAWAGVVAARAMGGQP